MRKSLLEFDEVMNEQRKTIYAWRQALLKGEDVRRRIWEMVEDSARDAAYFYYEAVDEDGNRTFAGLPEWFQERFGRPFEISQGAELSADGLTELLVKEADKVYRAKEEQIGQELMRSFERFLLLDKIDTKWKDHLYALDHLRDGIMFRGYAQIDPKIEYKRESLKAFDSMLESVREEVTSLLLKIEVEEGMDADRGAVFNHDSFLYDEMSDFGERRQAAIEQSQVADEKAEPIKADDKIPRNAPCPCGSGRKYKKCCGR